MSKNIENKTTYALPVKFFSPIENSVIIKGQALISDFEEEEGKFLVVFYKNKVSKSKYAIETLSGTKIPVVFYDESKQITNLTKNHWGIHIDSSDNMDAYIATKDELQEYQKIDKKYQKIRLHEIKKVSSNTYNDYIDFIARETYVVDERAPVVRGRNLF
jgi:hypothetical protein